MTVRAKTGATRESVVRETVEVVGVDDKSVLVKERMNMVERERP